MASPPSTIPPKSAGELQWLPHATGPQCRISAPRISTAPVFRSIHDHLFPWCKYRHAFDGRYDSLESLEAHRQFLEGSLRVDIFGIRRGEDVDAPFEAPDRSHSTPTLQPGETDTDRDGASHDGDGTPFHTGDRRFKPGVGRGRCNSLNGQSHRHTVVAQDANWRRGSMVSFCQCACPESETASRIDQRNVEDIFVALYNHQIPPGAAGHSVHYRLDVPDDAERRYSP